MCFVGPVCLALGAAALPVTHYENDAAITLHTHTHMYLHTNAENIRAHERCETLCFLEYIEHMGY